MVKDFLDLGLREGFTIEYKRNGDKVLDAVAAMANTYGGLVLVGVAEDSKHRELPGTVIGVEPGRKMELVNQMGSQYDPPWSPEVVDVPTGDGDKVVLVIRIDPDRAPRPIVHGGRIQVRLDGRDIPANRQLIRALLDENRIPEAANVGTLSRSPKRHHPPIRNDVDDPDVAVRVVASVPLWPVRTRSRLGPKTDETIIGALHESNVHQTLIQMARDIDELIVSQWAVGGRVSSHERCFSAGSRGGDGRVPGRPGIRVDCVIVLSGQGSNRTVEAFIDTLFWLPPARKLAMRLVVTALRATVPALLGSVLPSAVQLVTGYRIPMTPPPVELYIDSLGSSPNRNQVPLDDVVGLDWLGQRTGSGAVWHGAVLLDDELTAAGKWGEATNEALTVMAEDWGYLSPNIG